MSNNKVDPEKQKKQRDAIFQAMREEEWNDLTQLQKDFLSLPEFVQENGLWMITHEGSKAWLSHLDETIQLTMIQTNEEQRNQGHASQLLKTICELADKIGVTLSLRAEPKARKIGAPQEKLIEWYSRYGFEGRWNDMKRQPREAGGDPSCDTDQGK